MQVADVQGSLDQEQAARRQDRQAAAVLLASEKLTFTTEVQELHRRLESTAQLASTRGEEVLPQPPRASSCLSLRLVWQSSSCSLSSVCG